MQVRVHWETTNARDVGDGDIGPKTVHLLTMQEIVEDADERCVVDGYAGTVGTSRVCA